MNIPDKLEEIYDELNRLESLELSLNRMNIGGLVGKSIVEEIEDGVQGVLFSINQLCDELGMERFTLTLDLAGWTRVEMSREIDTMWSMVISVEDELGLT